MSGLRRFVERMIEPADIRIDGDRPWDVRVHDERLYRRVLSTGTLGLGDAYVEGWWDCDALDVMVDRAQRAGIAGKLRSPMNVVRQTASRLRNSQSQGRSFEVGERHYDIGNDLYERMLDTRMMYSCGYWRSAVDLDAAQEAKLALIGNKLGLEPGMRVLDIGCGWGGAAQYFAQRSGCEVVGITVSHEQARLARQRCADLPVEIRICDYRGVSEQFDRVYSIGMFEHVGAKNHGVYNETVRNCLADADGLALLHTIGGLESKHTTDPWIERHIFPNSMLPSAKQITQAAEGRLVLEDWHNFGADYDPTLMAWDANLASVWDELPRYDERFRRMWRYYLLTSAGSFRARRLQLWQVVFSRDGLPDAYRPSGIR